PLWGQGLLPMPENVDLPTTGPRDAVNQAATSPTPSSAAGGEPDVGPAMSLKVLGGIMASVQRSQVAVANHSQVSRLVVGVFGVGILLGLGRIAYGLTAIAILCRRSRVVVDERLTVMMDEARRKLNIRQS